MACRAALAIATPSAPSARAFTKSDSVRSPPVAKRLGSVRADHELSACGLVIERGASGQLRSEQLQVVAAR